MPRTLIPYTASLLLALALLGCSRNRYAHSVQQVPPPKQSSTSYTDSTITLAAGTHYTKSWLHAFLYGQHYRNVWAAPVTVPVLDIGSKYGGLEPLHLGGSRQTISLRLQDASGTEYVLRSLDKEPAGELPERWRHSYFAHIARDATSATNPYAPLVLPHMAKAIGMLHLEPELVYVPHDPRLGKHTDKVGGMLALLERHASGDQSDYAPMGRAPKVKSSRSAIEECLTDNDSRFLARAFLRARLFDMLIGDWSRHEGNWRWAELAYAPKAYSYLPIPRDRDNIFYKLDDGPIPWLLQSLGFKSNFQTFKEEISARQLKKLNKSGRNLDELILTELPMEAWLEVADSIQYALTDEVIAKAFAALPDTVAALTASDTQQKLQARRNALTQMALDYYKALQRQVQVVGTDKHEHFMVQVKANGDVEVRVYKATNDGQPEQAIYHRTFRPSETQQIDLYGLDGKDTFTFKADTKSRIRIGFWGGASEDSYHLGGVAQGKRLRLHDTQYRNELHNAHGKAKVYLNNDPKAQTFDAAGWMLRYYLD